ncbi:MAG: ABC transporter ATP-binding protein [Litoreibacter sp.]|nr:ABC transporter ATP-binding protein [Litoreibacter sp.]
MVTTNAPLRTENLSVVFNPDTETEVTAFRDISFELKSEEILAIVGPSGCGKSTLFNVIAGLQPATTGQVEVKNRQVADATGHVGYMLQKDMLLPWRTVIDNVCLGLEVQGLAKSVRRARAQELISAFGLAGFEQAKPGTLSGGMRQRVAFMRTLALDPDVILLDEPFSALDFQTRTLLQLEVMKIISEQKKSAVLVTHDIGEAVTMADRVLVLSRRPGTIKNLVEIDLSREDRDPVKLRKNDKFQYYFQALWEQLEL